MSEKYISAVAFKKLFECDKETVEAAFEKYAQKYNLDDAGKDGARYIFFGVTDLINESIDSIPAADVEPVVRGEWVGESGEECSACGARSKWFYKEFCPHCGAHMMERSGSGE